ncbi:hypothetical protein CSUI_002297 [Cystoisospora suis]|uniref:Uncharacterized protein n=1 Tax=Cystoisospora suis TaxID=483139 RepID=A0A2C6L9P4_9APIC|nr:hypothetical protein CSUI_002297 [Cystoisospora suis]
MARSETAKGVFLVPQDARTTKTNFDSFHRTFSTASRSLDRAYRHLEHQCQLQGAAPGFYERASGLHRSLPGTPPLDCCSCLHKGHVARPDSVPSFARSLKKLTVAGRAHRETSGQADCSDKVARRLPGPVATGLSRRGRQGEGGGGEAWRSYSAPPAAASADPLLVPFLGKDAVNYESSCLTSGTPQWTDGAAVRCGRRGVKGQQAAFGRTRLELKEAIEAGEAGVLHRLHSLRDLWRKVVLHFVLRREELTGGDLHFLATALAKFKHYDPLLLSLILDRTLRNVFTMPYHDLAGIVGCFARMRLLRPSKDQNDGKLLSPALSPLALDPLDCCLNYAGQPCLTLPLSAFEALTERTPLRRSSASYRDVQQPKRPMLHEGRGSGNALDESTPKAPECSWYGADKEACNFVDTAVGVSLHTGAARVSKRIEKGRTHNGGNTPVQQTSRGRVRTGEDTSHEAGQAASESAVRDAMFLGNGGQAGIAFEKAVQQKSLPAGEFGLHKATESLVPSQRTKDSFLGTAFTSGAPGESIRSRLRRGADGAFSCPLQSLNTPSRADEFLQIRSVLPPQESTGGASSSLVDPDAFDSDSCTEREAYMLPPPSLQQASFRWVASMIPTVGNALESSSKTRDLAYGERRRVLESRGWKVKALMTPLRLQAMESDECGSEEAWCNQRQEEARGRSNEGKNVDRLVGLRKTGGDTQSARDRIYQKFSGQARHVVRLAAERLPLALLDGEVTGQDLGLLCEGLAAARLHNDDLAEIILMTAFPELQSDKTFGSSIRSVLEKPEPEGAQEDRGVTEEPREAERSSLVERDSARTPGGHALFPSFASCSFGVVGPSLSNTSSATLLATSSLVGTPSFAEPADNQGRNCPSGSTAVRTASDNQGLLLSAFPDHHSSAASVTSLFPPVALSPLNLTSVLHWLGIMAAPRPSSTPILLSSLVDPTVPDVNLEGLAFLSSPPAPGRSQRALNSASTSMLPGFTVPSGPALPSSSLCATTIVATSATFWAAPAPAARVSSSAVCGENEGCPEIYRRVSVWQAGARALLQRLPSIPAYALVNVYSAFEKALVRDPCLMSVLSPRLVHQIDGLPLSALASLLTSLTILGTPHPPLLSSLCRAISKSLFQPKAPSLTQSENGGSGQTDTRKQTVLRLLAALPSMRDAYSQAYTHYACNNRDTGSGASISLSLSPPHDPSVTSASTGPSPSPRSFRCMAADTVSRRSISRSSSGRKGRCRSTAGLCPRHLDELETRGQERTGRNPAAGTAEEKEDGVMKGVRKTFGKDAEDKETPAEKRQQAETRKKNKARLEARKAAGEILTTLQLLCAEAAFFARQSSTSVEELLLLLRVQDMHGIFHTSLMRSIGEGIIRKHQQRQGKEPEAEIGRAACSCREVSPAILGMTAGTPEVASSLESTPRVQASKPAAGAGPSGFASPEASARRIATESHRNFVDSIAVRVSSLVCSPSSMDSSLYCASVFPLAWPPSATTPSWMPLETEQLVYLTHLLVKAPPLRHFFSFPRYEVFSLIDEEQLLRQLGFFSRPLQKGRENNIGAEGRQRLGGEVWSLSGYEQSDQQREEDEPVSLEALWTRWENVTVTQERVLKEVLNHFVGLRSPDSVDANQGGKKGLSLTGTIPRRDLSTGVEKLEGSGKSVLGSDSLSPTLVGTGKMTVAKATKEEPERAEVSPKENLGSPRYACPVSSQSRLSSACLSHSDFLSSVSALSSSITPSRCGGVRSSFSGSSRTRWSSLPGLQALPLPALVVLLETVASFSRNHILHQGGISVRLCQRHASKSSGHCALIHAGVTSGSSTYLPRNERGKGEKELWESREKDQESVLQLRGSETTTTSAVLSADELSTTGAGMQGNFFFPSHFFDVAQFRLSLAARRLLGKRLVSVHRAFHSVSNRECTQDRATLISDIFGPMTSRRIDDVGENSDGTRGEVESCAAARIEERESCRPWSGNEGQQAAILGDAEVIWLLRGVQALVEAEGEGAGVSDLFVCISTLLVLRWRGLLPVVSGRTTLSSEGPSGQAAPGQGAKAESPNEIRVPPRDLVGFFEGVNSACPADAVLSSPGCAGGFCVVSDMPPRRAVFAPRKEGNRRKSVEQKEEECAEEDNGEQNEDNQVAQDGRGGTGEGRAGTTVRDAGVSTRQCALAEGQTRQRDEERQPQEERSQRRSGEKEAQQARRRCTGGDNMVKKMALRVEALKTLLHEAALLLRALRLWSYNGSSSVCFSSRTGLSSPCAPSLPAMHILLPKLLSSVTDVVSAAAFAPGLVPSFRDVPLTTLLRRETAVYGKPFTDSGTSSSVLSVGCLGTTAAVDVNAGANERKPVVHGNRERQELRSTATLNGNLPSGSWKGTSAGDSLGSFLCATTLGTRVQSSSPEKKRTRETEVEWSEAGCNRQLQTKAVNLLNEAAGVVVALFEESQWRLLTERSCREAARRPVSLSPYCQEHSLISRFSSGFLSPLDDSESYLPNRGEFLHTPRPTLRRESDSDAPNASFTPLSLSTCVYSLGACSCTFSCSMMPGYHKILELLSLALRLSFSVSCMPSRCASPSLADSRLFASVPSPSCAGEDVSRRFVFGSSCDDLSSSGSRSAAAFCQKTLSAPYVASAGTCFSVHQLRSILSASTTQPLFIFMSFFLPVEALVRFPLWILRVLTVAKQVAEAELFSVWSTRQTKLSSAASTSQSRKGAEGRSSWAGAKDRSQGEKRENEQENSQQQNFGFCASGAKLACPGSAARRGSGGEFSLERSDGQAGHRRLLQYNEDSLPGGLAREAFGASGEAELKEASLLNNAEMMRAEQDETKDWQGRMRCGAQERPLAEKEQRQLNVLFEKEVQLSVAHLSVQHSKNRRAKQPNYSQDTKTASQKSGWCVVDPNSKTGTCQRKREVTFSNWLCPALILHLEPQSGSSGFSDVLSRLDRCSREMLRMMVEAEKRRAQREERQIQRWPVPSSECAVVCKDERGGFRFFNLRVTPTTASRATELNGDRLSPTECSHLGTEGHIDKRRCGRDTTATEKRREQRLQVEEKVEESAATMSASTKTVELHPRTGAEEHLKSSEYNNCEEVGVNSAGDGIHWRESFSPGGNSPETARRTNEEGEELQNNGKVSAPFGRLETTIDLGVLRGPPGDSRHVMRGYRPAGVNNKREVGEARSRMVEVERDAARPHRMKDWAGKTGLGKPAYWLPTVPENADLRDLLRIYDD